MSSIVRHSTRVSREEEEEGIPRPRPLLFPLLLTATDLRRAASSKLARSRRDSENKDQQVAPRIREISSNVGFVSLPDQVHRRAVKKGFEFNLMVVGKHSLSSPFTRHSLFVQGNLAWASPRSSTLSFKLNCTDKISLPRSIERRKPSPSILHRSFSRRKAFNSD